MQLVPVVKKDKSQQAYVIVAVQKHTCQCKKVPTSILGWSSNTIKRECDAPQFGGRDKQLGNVHGTAGLGENTVKPHDDCTCQLQQLRGCFGKSGLRCW